MAPSRSLWDKYFSRYDFFKIYLWKIKIDFFFWFFKILCRINKGVYICLLEHANTKKTCLWAQLLICEGIFEHFSSFSSLGLVYSFWFQKQQMNKYFHTCLSKQNKKKHVREQSCSSIGAFTIILAHLAHLPCSFTLILNRINTIMFWP